MFDPYQGPKFRLSRLLVHHLTICLLQVPHLYGSAIQHCWSTPAVSYSCCSVLYLIYLVFSQNNSLWRDSGYPGNGWRVIAVVLKEKNTSQIEKVSLHLLPSAHPWCLVSVYGASPLYPSTYQLVATSLALSPASPPSPPYAVPSPLSYSSDFWGERKSSSWSFMSSILMYLAPSVPKSSSPSENNMPKRAEQTEVRLVKQHKRKRERKKQGC